MHRIAFSIATLFALASPAFAANENVVTQSKALAGNVTPGDTPGYPITINTPGAYVLGSGLDVTPGQWGIVVNANGVNIDMSGYTLSGNGVADYGVVSGYNNGRIHDGNISAFKASGMYLRGNAWKIRDMQIERNSLMGIDATGAASIELCSSLVGSNKGSGMLSGDGTLVHSSSFSANTGRGLECGARCNVQQNTFELNGGTGLLMTSGIAIGNMMANNGSLGFGERDASDVGYANNILINNTAPAQRTGGLDMHPNACAGSGC